MFKKSTSKNYVPLIFFIITAIIGLTLESYLRDKTTVTGNKAIDCYLIGMEQYSKLCK